MMLNPDAAARVPDLFAEAQALPPEERAAFLARACDGDDALRAEIESLLRTSTETRNFLSGQAFDFDDDLFPHHAAAGELSPGEMLGDCRIVSLLGIGGMGEVYLADDTVLGRPVAVKLVSPDRGGTLLRHFRHERKVLAALNHPHIARLYGSAVTPEGRAYLVMEYVEGERLDEYCDRRRLDVPARLALFRKVCAAVAYAHQNLVVHRDLKPANIRVTPEGEPKLLDFGIAKLLETQDPAPGAEPTLTLVGAMTPEYASPEQLRGEAITTATDVYSLGVVLYELLAGQRPYRLKSRRPDEIARAICEQEPERPSTVVKRRRAEAGSGKSEVGSQQARSGQRSPGARKSAGQSSAPPEDAETSDFRLPTSHFVHSDLDNIVALAMRKEPARRYASVAQLSEDLRRYAEGLPVTARRDTLPYRAGKFVRRNKTLAAAALLVALSLVGGLVATAWQARVAGQERDRARLAQRQAERMNDFLQTLLGSVDPSSGPGRNLTVIQVLDRASRDLDRELAAEPAILAQAHLTLGTAYAGLRDAEPALEHLRAALKLDQSLYGDDAPATTHARTMLGLTLASPLYRYAEAGPLLQRALAATRLLPPGQRQDLGPLLEQGGILLGSIGRFPEAEAMGQESLALSRREHGEESEAYVRTLNQLASLALSQGDFPLAEQRYQQTAALCRRLPPSRALLLPKVLEHLAYVQALLKKADDARQALMEAQDIYRRTVGEDNVTYNSTLGTMGWIDYLRGDYALAETELRQAVKTVTPLLPRGDQDVVGGTTVLGLALVRLGRPAEAEPILRDCLELARTHDLEGVPAPGNIAGALGECLFRQGRYTEAEPLLLADYERHQKGLDNHRPEYRAPGPLLHEMYLAWNKPAEAALYPSAPDK